MRTNLPELVTCGEIDAGPEVADAAGSPNDNPETMVAAASPAAPMDLKAVAALFL
jgi:hypothetical protein